VRGVIERRLLIAYRLDPDVAQGLLPLPFRPRLINGYAVAAVVLARLARLRPAGLPTTLGLTRECAAHALAVEWRTGHTLHTGAYVLHRDSAAADGPRLAPRLRRAAQFTVDERTDGLQITYRSADRSTQVNVDVSLAAGLTGSALFPDLRAAARFFEPDGEGVATGAWVPRRRGLRLTATDGALSAANVRIATSSILADPVVFPPGSLHLDSALLLRDVAVAWAPAAQVRVARRAATSLA
jgi:hypothetical protein